MYKQVTEVNGKLSRSYQEKKCKNPNCINGGSYIPRRSNQYFCIPKCKEIYYNDRKKENNNTVYKEEKELRRFDNFLNMAYNLHVDDDGYCCVYKGLFENNKINTYMTLDINLAEDNNTHMHSTYRYYYYPSPSDPDFFIIKKKN